MALLSPRLQAQIVKELLSVLRDPKSRAVLTIPPLFQLLIFSFAATLELKHVDIAIHNRDAGRWGYELTARVGAAGFVRAVRPVHGLDQIQDVIDRREVIAALDIPEDFSRNIAARHPARVQVILDGRRANAAQILLGYLNAIVTGLDAGSSLDTGHVAVRHGFNPNLIYRWFIVPSLGGVLVMFVTLLVTALSIARERELGTFDQLLVSPCTPAEIIVAKIVPALLIGTLLGLFMAAAGVFGFGIPFTGSFPLLFASLLLFIVSIVGIGLMISSICDTQQQAILGTFAVGVPAVLVSGFATPVENMPEVLQWLAEAIPLKHYLIILQGSFLKALPPAEVFAHAWPMAVIAVATLSTATLFVRGKLQ
ncbi:ABC transporter permease [Methylomagnum ishizawai]|uniref:ABC transporter permease n=1 Tax=Methylomagnum ishizawai TaxID=1760988 RepID=UPI001C328F44|nr:ABC transporter permease [Methylomagnum ishizawai]BBL77089.1 ABC transporter permease [Methylomagnum ishizawai]